MVNFLGISVRTVRWILILLNNIISGQWNPPRTFYILSVPLSLAVHLQNGYQLARKYFSVVLVVLLIVFTIAAKTIDSFEILE